MVFIKYHLESGQVVLISLEEFEAEEGYGIAKSHEFSEGDEFDKTIYINTIDGEGNVTSFATIKNTSAVKKILIENDQLRRRQEATDAAVLQLLMEGMI